MSEKTDYKGLVDTIVIEIPTRSIEIAYSRSDYINYPQVNCYSEKSACFFEMQIQPRVVKLEFIEDFVGKIYLGNDILRVRI